MEQRMPPEPPKPSKKPDLHLILELLAGLFLCLAPILEVAQRFNEENTQVLASLQKLGQILGVGIWFIAAYLAVAFYIEKGRQSGIRREVDALKDEKKGLESQLAQSKSDLEKSNAENRRLENDKKDLMCKVQDRCFIKRRLSGNNVAEKMWDEANKFEDVLANNATTIQVTSSEYIRRAKEARQAETWSIHLLYATEQSVLDYYSHSHVDWLKNEAAESKDRRRRIIIIASELFPKDGKILRQFKTLVDNCDASSQVLLLREDDGKDKCPHILRDCGVFGKADGWRLSQQYRGFFTYAPFPNLHAFAQCPGRFYVVEDDDYLEGIKHEFDSVFNDLQLNDQSRRLKNIISAASPTDGLGGT
jgi:hypothetical protein